MLEAVRRGNRTIVSAIMGAGKSVLIAELAWLARHGKKPDHQIVVSAPRKALVRQLGATIEKRLGEKVGRYFSDAKDTDHDVIITCNPSAQKLAARLDSRCALWIVDEVHQSETETLHAAAEILNPAAAVGFTATPYRSDTAQRLQLWQEIGYSYSLGDALRDGVLVPWDVHNWYGDGDAEDVDQICLDMIRDHCAGPGIVSSFNIADAEEHAAYLRDNDLRAEPIHSRQSLRRQDELIAALRDGQLDCLVHVSLLAEGVDFPWLRWLCLRRRVSARVRFLQEIGRVLRCHPGKKRATILDPYDLFGVHGLHHAATLGTVAETVEPEPDDSLDFPELELPPEGFELPPAVAVNVTGAWARRLLLVLQADGLARQDNVADEWRTGNASVSQIRYLSRLARSADALPPAHRETLQAIAWGRSSERLKRGAASDLITVLECVRWERRRDPSWTWPTTLPVPVLPVRVLQAM